MNWRTTIWVGLAGAVGVFGALGVWQHARGVALRVERDRLIGRQLARARAEAKPRRFAETASPEELARLRAKEEELREAQDALAKLERTLADTSGAVASLPSEAKAAADEPPPLRGPMVKSADWRNVGAASPEASLESFVWAATRGEMATLATLLAVDDAGRTKLAEVFGQLSDEARASYGSPEAMAATLIAVQVPQDLSAIGAVNALSLSNGDIALRTRLERGGAITKDVSLVFRLTGGRWQLVVPREIASGAVAAALKTSAPAHQ